MFTELVAKKDHWHYAYEDSRAAPFYFEDLLLLNILLLLKIIVLATRSTLIRYFRNLHTDIISNKNMQPSIKRVKTSKICFNLIVI